MELLAIRMPNGAFMPLDDDVEEVLERFKLGATVRLKAEQMRNARFFRKFFVLARFAFDLWEESAPAVEYKGQQIKPSFDRFRKDLTILAGYYDPVVNVKGELRMEPRSISWAKMTEEDFEKLYSAAIDVILKRFLAAKGMTEEEIRKRVDQLIGGFA